MTITTRSGKGSALTHPEMDANLNAFNQWTTGPATKTIAKTLTPEDGVKIYPQGSDGGVFIGGTGKAAGYYNDNGGAFYGTRFKPTGGDGTVGWERPDALDGKFNVRDFGAFGEGADYSAEIVLADAAAGLGGLGAELLFPPGTYNWTGTLTPSAGVEWVAFGNSQFNAKLKAIDATSVISFTLQGHIRGFYIEGSSITPGTYVGTGIYFNASISSIKNCFIRYFQTGVRLAGGFWQVIEKCRINFNQINIDFNAKDAASFTNALAINYCYNGHAERNGIAGTNVPIRNNAIKITGGSIESNSSVAPATYPQIALGSCSNYSFDTVYIENRNATPSDAVNLNGMGNGSFENCYFDTADTHIIASAVINGLVIQNCRFLGSITNSVNLPAANTQAYAVGCDFDIDPIIAGDDSGWIRSKIAEMPSEGKTSTTTLVGHTTAGTTGYVWQLLYYSQIGNEVSFNGAVRIDATGLVGAVGNMEIEGLPAAARNVSVGQAVVDLLPSQVTPPANYFQMKGLIQPNTTYIELWWQNTLGGTNLRVQPADIGINAIIYYTGKYPLAPGVHI